MSTTPYLLDEKVISLSPTLAAAIGVNEALVIQQIHYWISHNAQDKDKAKTHFKEGMWWTWNTYDEWRDDNFIFWSKRTIERIVTNLEAMGLVVSRQFDKSYGRMHKWYSIDYDLYRKFMETWKEAGSPTEGTKGYKTFIEAWLLDYPSRQLDEMHHDNLTSSPRQSDVIITDKTTEANLTEKEIPPTPLKGGNADNEQLSCLVSNSSSDSQSDSPLTPPIAPTPSSPQKRATHGKRATKVYSERVPTDIERAVGRWWWGYVLAQDKPWLEAWFEAVDPIVATLASASEERHFELTGDKVLEFVQWYWQKQSMNGSPMQLPGAGKVMKYFNQWLDRTVAPPPPPEGTPRRKLSEFVGRT